jgi:hypothetical protein
MEKGNSSQEFRPEPIPRRGELIAWVCTLLVGAAWFILARSEQGVNWMVPILAIPLLLVALSISLGNWVDRSTRLRLGREGVAFQNGLRRVRLAWNEIRQVQVTPGPWGKRVEVLGPDSHFRFYTLGEVKMAGQVKGRTGFAAGEMILNRILEKSNLRQGTESGIDRRDSGYYFTRE